ncbi:hypothetical protein ZWY2020_028764 [Hordeum vulgare]|nr:hypothetical protein ZWY2020_028764 [Hordeum vulgare]
MLVRGLDSVAASFAQLSDTLTAAHKVTMDSTGGSFLPSPFKLHDMTLDVLVFRFFQGVNALASCSSQARERESGEEECDVKRHCGGASTKFAALETLSLPFYNLRLNQPRPPHFPSPRGRRPPAPG